MTYARRLLATVSILALFGIASITAPSSTATAQYSGRKGGAAMPDTPDYVNEWLWLKVWYDPFGDESEIALPDHAGYIKVGYNPATNRIRIFESSGDHREIPSASIFPPYQLKDRAIPFIDDDGNLNSTSTDVPNLNPIFDLGFLPTPVYWPQGDQGTPGDALSVFTTSPELDTIGGSHDRPQLYFTYPRQVRRSAEVFTASIDNLETENGYVVLASTFRLIRIAANADCRVRLYATTAARTADAARAFEYPAADGAGVIADFMIDVAAPIIVTPQITGSNLEAGDPLTLNNQIYYAIENRSGSAASVQVVFTYQPLE